MSKSKGQRKVYPRLSGVVLSHSQQENFDMLQLQHWVELERVADHEKIIWLTGSQGQVMGVPWQIRGFWVQGESLRVLTISLSGMWEISSFHEEEALKLNLPGQFPLLGCSFISRSPMGTGQGRQSFHRMRPGAQVCRAVGSWFCILPGRNFLASHSSKLGWFLATKTGQVCGSQASQSPSSGPMHDPHNPEHPGGPGTFVSK